MRLTSPPACAAEPDPGDLFIRFELNGQPNGGSNWYRAPNVTRVVPSQFSESIFNNSGVAFPGEYDFTTIIDESQLVPSCHGVVVETEVFVDSATSV
jgi:hypothetical protein